MTPQQAAHEFVATPPRQATTGRLARLLPPVLVLGALAALAYWGHLTDWRFTSKPMTRAAVSSARSLQWEQGPVVDGCALHGLPTCPICSPETAETNNPPPTRKAPVARSAARPPAALRRPASLILASAQEAENLGIAVEPAWPADLAESIDAPGELQLDPRLVARIAARVGGTAMVVKARRGDEVKQGQLLAVIDSVEVGRLKAEWLKAVVQVRLRERALRDIESAAEKVAEPRRRDAEAAWREAEVRMGAAEQALINLRLRLSAVDKGSPDPARLAERLRRVGLPPDVDDGGSNNLLPVVSPLDGVLLQADVVAGERVEPGHALFVVADPRRLMVVLHVATTDAAHVKLGQTVRFRPDGADDDAEGKVASIAPSADESTRRFTVRAEVENKRNFRASTLGRGRILVRSIPQTIAVPKSAVVEIEGWPSVFVRDRSFLKEDGRHSFHLRPVQLGVQEHDQREVVAGLAQGELVVAKGVALLASEYARQSSHNEGRPSAHVGDHE